MRLIPILILLGTATGCADAECGPNMELHAEMGVCVCVDGSVADGGGCRLCAADEVAVNGACTCPENQAKDASGVCAELPGLGAPCSATTPCDSPVFDVCYEHLGESTCTRGCASDTDCPGEYVCADWEATPVCRTFTGVGAACNAPEDCASYDASSCVQNLCVVQGCTVGVDDCPRDSKCCDFSAFGFGTICAPPEYCP